MRNRLYFLGLIFFLVNAVTVSAWAQAPRFIFDTGDTVWGGERIQLPPGFAPEMTWVGEEDIRFAPGMFKAEADDFFTYVLLFLLEKGSDVSPEKIEREVLTYYQGLSKGVMKGKGKEVDAGKFTVELKKEDAPASTPAGIEAKSVTQFGGILDWVEPFATQKAQKLHLEVQLWTHGGQPALFLCVSPKARDTEIWNTLRKIRESFRIEDS
jgi:hypothetical protein